MNLTTPTDNWKTLGRCFLFVCGLLGTFSLIAWFILGELPAESRPPRNTLSKEIPVNEETPAGAKVVTRATFYVNGEKHVFELPDKDFEGVVIFERVVISEEDK